MICISWETLVSFATLISNIGHHPVLWIDVLELYLLVLRLFLLYCLNMRLTRDTGRFIIVFIAWSSMCFERHWPTFSWAVIDSNGAGLEMESLWQKKKERLFFPLITIFPFCFSRFRLSILILHVRICQLYKTAWRHWNCPFPHEI